MADIVIRGMENIPVGQAFVIVENIDFERYLYNPETGAAFHLVPLPEGHGRLGDLDALQEEFKKYHDGKRLMLIDTALTIVPAEGGGVDG